MSKSARASNPKAVAVRLGVLAVVGLAAMVAVRQFRSPLSLSEAEVRRMVAAHALNGLTLAEAAAKLQQRAPATQDGRVLVDFSNIRSWRAGSLVLEVRAGRVVAAAWGDGSETQE